LQIDRRQFLLTALGGPGLASRKPAPAPLLDRGFARVTKIADGLSVTIADPNKGPQCLSNGGVIFGRHAALIVEGHFQPEGAALEIEAARLVSKAPIMAAVDTHYHLDHSFGNLSYANQHIPIMAHVQAPALMKARYADLKGIDKAPLLAPLERKVAQAANPDDRRHFQSDLDGAKWMFDAIGTVTLAYPTQLFAAKDLPKRIDLGGLTAIVEFHRGHTPTDLIVTVPERDVVFTGDLLFHRAYPVSFDADMNAWHGVLTLFAGYGRQMRFVPGHGPICGLETVREQVDILDDLRSHAEKMIRTGASVDEAERRYMVPKRFQDFDVSPWNWTVGAALQGYYAALISVKPT
jgi:glyoxylase-like metal-dependent hydrolase (beta-lactamase superfamily II)